MIPMGFVMELASLGCDLTVFSLLLVSLFYASFMCVGVEWADEQLPPTNILRLIYQGRFLHGNVTLAGGCAAGSHLES